MTYAGNRIFNGNNGGAVFLLLLGVGMHYAKTGNGFLLLMIPVALLLTITQAFYFEITVDDLIVKNYMVPFLNSHYKLNEITKIEFWERTDIRVQKQV